MTPGRGDKGGGNFLLTIQVPLVLRRYYCCRLSGQAEDILGIPAVNWAESPEPSGLKLSKGISTAARMLCSRRSVTVTVSVDRELRIRRAFT
jgi:hypothetical protein